jgi:protein ImuA
MVSSKAHIISQLQNEILLLQGFKPCGIEGNDAGLNVIKDAFPNSTFPLGAVHEFFCTDSESNSASYGFIAGIVSSLMKTNTPSIWISSSKLIFPTSLKSFGIDPDKIIFIQSKRSKEILWVVEEALKSNSVSAVVGEINEISFLESRRLQLAVEQSKVTGFLLRQNPKNLATSCVTRWRVTPIPSEKKSIPGIGFPKWNVELLKVRNGKPGRWQMQWRNLKFELVQPSILAYEEEQRKVV